MKHQAKKQTRNQHMPVVIVCILILVLAVMGLGMHFIKKYIPTKERMNLTEYYGQPGDCLLYTSNISRRMKTINLLLLLHIWIIMKKHWKV